MINYYLLVPKKISLIITSIFFFKNDDFAENEALIPFDLITRRKKQSITRLILAKLTGKNIVK